MLVSLYITCVPDNIIGTDVWWLKQSALKLWYKPDFISKQHFRPLNMKYVLILEDNINSSIKFFGFLKHILYPQVVDIPIPYSWIYFLVYMYRSCNLVNVSILFSCSCFSFSITMSESFVLFLSFLSTCDVLQNPITFLSPHVSMLILQCSRYEHFLSLSLIWHELFRYSLYGPILF